MEHGQKASVLVATILPLVQLTEIARDVEHSANQEGHDAN